MKSGGISQGIDFIRVAQILGGLICALAIIWVILRFVLHML